MVLGALGCMNNADFEKKCDESYSDVYRGELGRCHTLSFFLIFLIISPFQIFLLYFYINRSISDTWRKNLAS